MMLGCKSRRCQSDSGKPTVRDKRGATGNVILLRENARACFLPDCHDLVRKFAANNFQDTLK